jgi:hypothetical protein
MEMEEQAPTTPLPTEVEENNDEEMGMAMQDKGKGREMDAEKDRAKKEWLRWYSRDLILPEGGLPDDYMTGVIRVVDGKQYQLDDYQNQLENPEFTPLEICNVRGRGSLSHYLVYSESPSRWCSLAIILPIYLHHNLLLVSNRSIQNTYRLVTLAVLTLLSLSCSLERFAFEYHVNISKTRYP